MRDKFGLVFMIVLMVFGQASGEIIMEEVLNIRIDEGPVVVVDADVPVDEPKVTDQADDILAFVNGDTIQGTLNNGDANGALFGFLPLYSRKSVEFLITGVDMIHLKNRGAADYKWGNAVAVMSNSDEMWGEIVSLDEDILKMRTSYAGDISIKKSMIRNIVIKGESSSLLYEGPKSLQEWVVNNRHNQAGGQSWRFSRGALIGSQIIPVARRIKDMPDKVRVDFDLEWRGAYPGIALAVFNDNLNNLSDCYSVAINGNNAYLYRYSNASGSANLGTAEIQLGGAKVPRANITFLADRKEKIFALLVNGALVKQWTDKLGVIGKGDAVMFQPQNQFGTRISNIKISEWDGDVPVGAETADSQIKEDMISLKNGDKVSGKLISISRDTVKFKSAYAEIGVPLDRVANIAFETQGGAEARRNSTDIRVTMLNGGTLTIDFNSLKDGILDGSNESFGTVRIPLGAAQSIECNIYSEKTQGGLSEF